MLKVWLPSAFSIESVWWLLETSPLVWDLWSSTGLTPKRLDFWGRLRRLQRINAKTYTDAHTHTHNGHTHTHTQIHSISLQFPMLPPLSGLLCSLPHFWFSFWLHKWLFFRCFENRFRPGFELVFDTLRAHAVLCLLNHGSALWRQF